MRAPHGPLCAITQRVLSRTPSHPRATGPRAQAALDCEHERRFKASTAPRRHARGEDYRRRPAALRPPKR